ncbi:Tetratricopeptide repeat protein 29 [Merluccius polli]|uniref:Tetratricopeptide repeat protein 29 n=1 Tax=Merluccius polli TaxID=89951 RepID=A0AA47P5P8_MERPO|nr:Tetratricopeptide repeat protein 29 [Merluccius polli]
MAGLQPHLAPVRLIGLWGRVVRLQTCGAEFRNSLKQKVCVELLRRGYHRSFSELYSLLIGCEERRCVLEEQDSLDALQLHLSRAEDAHRTGDWAGVYASQLSLAERSWAPEEAWLSLYFYQRSLDAASRLTSSHQPDTLTSSPYPDTLTSSHPETLVTSRLARLYLQLGELEEARRYSERFLQLAERGPVREQASRLLVQVYICLAELPVHQPGALQLLHTAYHTAANCGDSSVKGEAAYRLGLAYQRTGDHPSAMKFLTVSMEIFSLLQETDALGKTYKALSQSEQRTTEKVEYLEKYVGISRIKGHHGNLQDAYMSLGAFYCSQGQYSSSTESYQQGFNLACSLGDVERIQRSQVSPSGTHDDVTP